MNHRLPLGLAAVFVAVLAAVPRAQAAFPGQPGRIAFDRYDPAAAATVTYTMTSKGRDVQRQFTGSFAGWSPSGRTAAFISAPGPTLSRARADGSGASVLTGEGYSAAWSRDARTIAFVRDLDDEDGAGFATLFAISAKGGNARQLVEGLFPSWSPRGKLIAYTDGDRGLYVIRPDGTGRKRIFKASVYLSDVDWLPDGRSLVVVRQRPNTADTKEVLRVSRSGRLLDRIAAGKGVGEVSVSPDGKRVVYSQTDGKTGVTTLWRVSVRGGTRTEIGQGDHPTWLRAR